jgi:hypothetical protein
VKRQEKQAAPVTNSVKVQRNNISFLYAQGVTIRKNEEGSGYIELGKKRRVTVREFKGMQTTECFSQADILSIGQTLIDIREFYGDDGEEKPGKKGISLNVEQVCHDRASPPSLC